jgi:hypothetical protein
MGKMCFRVWEMLKNEQIAKGSTIILLHTGGLQGIMHLIKNIIPNYPRVIQSNNHDKTIISVHSYRFIDQQL